MYENRTKGPIIVDARDGKFFLTADRSITDVEGVGIAYKRDDADLFAAAATLLELAEDAVPILEAVLDDREAANGEECEILRDLLDRFRAATIQKGNQL